MYQQYTTFLQTVNWGCDILYIKMCPQFAGWHWTDDMKPWGFVFPQQRAEAAPNCRGRLTQKDQKKKKKLILNVLDELCMKWARFF